MSEQTARTQGHDRPSAAGISPAQALIRSLFETEDGQRTLSYMEQVYGIAVVPAGQGLNFTAVSQLARQVAGRSAGP
jgi:hypothetical protein